MKGRLGLRGVIGAALVVGGCVFGPRAMAEEHATAAANPPVGMPEALTLDWCLARAREANPALMGAQASAEAAASRVAHAGALEDPRFAYEASNIPTGDFDFDSTPLSGHQLGLRQKLPFPGLLSTRKRAARRSAEAATLMVDDHTLATDGEVEMAWAEVGFAQRALEITRRNVALLRQLSATAESRYRVGGGLQQDVLRAQVELTALIQEELRRQEAVEAVETRLIALLDLPAAERLPPVVGLEFGADEPELPPLLASIEDRNPRLRARRKAVEAAEARSRAAELEGLPDLDVGIGYRIRQNVAGDPVDGDDFISAGFTVRLPVDRSKWRARVSEEHALLRRARADLREARAEISARTRRSHAALVRAAAEESLLATGLVPQARQSLKSSRSAYEVGRIDFLRLLDSQVRLLDAELRLARARADKRVAFASLEAAAGEKLR